MPAHLPGVIDERGVILSGALRYAAVESPANLLQCNLLRSGKTGYVHKGAKRAAPRCQPRYITGENQDELGIGHLSRNRRDMGIIPGISASGIQGWNCKFRAGPGLNVVVMRELPVVAEAKSVLTAQEMDSLADVTLQTLGVGIVRFS